MRKYLVLPALLFAMACKQKPAENTNTPAATTASDSFFAAYKQLRLPFSISDTTWNLLRDSSTITVADYEKLVPDTALVMPFGKDRNLEVYPVGKWQEKGKETYFVTHVKGRNNEALYLGVFDKNKFQTSMPLLVSNDDDIVHAASIDKRLTIVLNNEWIEKNVLYYNRQIYAYNNVGIFTTVLTETNLERRSAENTVPNPLDTFPKKYKYSGDYTKGARSFVSLRDGANANTYRLFMHFDNGKEDDPCGGELKGELRITSEKTGVFNGNGDPCSIDFTFSGNEVRVKENGSCGNYRGIKCFFNDTYTRKKEPKAAKTTKKK